MKKQYRPLLDRLNESRNRYQQLTGTSNKTILRENKTLITEAGCTVWMSLITWFDCPPARGGYGTGQNAGWMYVQRHNDCSWTTHTGGCGDRNKPPKDVSEPTGTAMNEQTNPFTGGGSGPNWQAAEAAWTNFQQSSQSSPPNPDATFLSNMAGKGCGFYESRLTAQVNSFISNFGGSFGSGSNSSNAANAGSNPAWQSQKYARIMWLADKVQDCSGSNTPGIVQCINDWIDDSSNDSVMTSAQCANGNPALSAGNIENTKFRHKTIADCTTLQNKIDQMATMIPNETGCNVIRKQAKHDYLVNLKSNCC